MPLIRDLYIPVLQGVMAEHNIASPIRPPSHVVGADAGFDEVVRNTAWYCWLGDRQPHYRYRRYRDAFGDPQPPRDGHTRLAHVDIGCGAGIFSWALLDWASDSNLAHDRIDLYGLDHSPAMIILAYRMREQLMTSIANYPELHYETMVQMLLQELTAHHQDPTDYIVTFGHVLVQARHPNAILNFTRVIVHILGLIGEQSQCALLAVDARRRAREFASGWDALLSSLAQYGVRHEEIAAQRGSITAVLMPKS